MKRVSQRTAESREFSLTGNVDMSTVKKVISQLL